MHFSCLRRRVCLGWRGRGLTTVSGLVCHVLLYALLFVLVLSLSCGLVGLLLMPQQPPHPSPSKGLWLERTASGVQVLGTHDSPDYRLFLAAGGQGQEQGPRLSFWHDLFLRAPKSPTARVPLFNFLCEIPRGSRAKMEVKLQEPFNPIAQDLTKEGELRFFRYGDVPFNYGCLPQTWENPELLTEETGSKGDGDPLDVVEIGPDPILSGRVHAVKVLGILGMIDSGETDWKVIAISRQDPDLFHALHNIEDVDTHLPGKLDSIRDWFRYYKVAEGKSESQFAFQGKFQDQEYAMRIIEETHQQWKELALDKNHPQRGHYWFPK